MALLPAMFLGLLSTGANAAQIGHYEFRETLENSITTPDALPTLTAVTNGTSPEAHGYDANGWYWNSGNSGLKIEAENQSLETFSIGIEFTFFEDPSYPDYTGYQKIIDFGGLTSDFGLYTYNHQIALYAYGSVPSGGVVAKNTPLSLILTRDSQGEIAIYQRGSETPIITHTDISGNFTIGESLAFFLDDRNGSEYSPFGSVSLLRLWDTALTPQEVTTAFEAIPEPGTLTLVGGTAAAALAFRRLARRRRD